MKDPVPDKKALALINDLVAHAAANERPLRNLLQNLSNTFSVDEQLMRNVHSMRWRIKNPNHLKDKLIRKWIEARKKGRKFVINRDNLFVKVNDLAGFRILHLHTRQFQEISESLQRLFGEQFYRVIEGPKARTWDDESREYFRSINTKFVKSTNPLYKCALRGCSQPKD